MHAFTRDYRSRSALKVYSDLRYSFNNTSEKKGVCGKVKTGNISVC